MTDLALILFDDAVARKWEPFALTRPVGELLYGALTFRRRAEIAFRATCVAQICAAHLQAFDEAGAAPVVQDGGAPRAGDRLFWLSRAIASWATRRTWMPPERSGAIVMDGRPVGWFSRSTDAPPPEDFLRDPSAFTLRDAPIATVEGAVLERVWEMIPSSHEQVALDVEALHGPKTASVLPDGVFHWGRHPVVLGEGARLEPGCALDSTEGPIWIDRGTTVRSFTRLAGPSYIGPDSTVLGGAIGPVSTGPVCRIRGEIAESICLGYTNKQHDGHIGHAYLGRWVNLGAETTNSDLKNNYSTIRLWTPEGDEDTGAIKMGCLLGDHVKTGIGVLLNTGTVVGAGSNLWGALLPPKFVPPFSWGSGDELTQYRLDKFLEVAERAMGRRGVELSEAARVQLGVAWELSAPLRGT